MAENVSDGEKETGVVLGFLEEAEPWRLHSSQFPSKVGGKPAWLSQLHVPAQPELLCGKCELPLGFLLQVYGPIVGSERSFHRTLYVFCCRTPACYTRNDNSCFKVFRSQLPRKNDFYPYDPPPEEPADSVEDHRMLSSGVKLCWVCGCPGQKACSRCHSVTYCSKEHQTIHWKQQHKKECCTEGASSTSEEHNSFLFPEWELVTEPEKLPVKDEESHNDSSEGAECASTELEETELESMALHETQETKVFQKFKKCIATEPEQVLRYCRASSPLWLSSEHVPRKADVPKCPCGANRQFEFQIMPQLLNHLKVDRPDASIDWGTLVIYTCSDSCDQGNKYSPEFIWKQDISEDRAH